MGGKALLEPVAVAFVAAHRPTGEKLKAALGDVAARVGGRHRAGAGHSGARIWAINQARGGVSLTRIRRNELVSMPHQREQTGGRRGSAATFLPEQVPISRHQRGETQGCAVLYSTRRAGRVCCP